MVRCVYLTVNYCIVVWCLTQILYLFLSSLRLLTFVLHCFLPFIVLFIKYTVYFNSTGCSTTVITIVTFILLLVGPFTCYTLSSKLKMSIFVTFFTVNCCHSLLIYVCISDEAFPDKMEYSPSGKVIILLFYCHDSQVMNLNDFCRMGNRRKYLSARRR